MRIFWLLFIFPCLIAAEENFLLVDGVSGAKIFELGSRIDERMTPCSTFKIALSLMGFDSGILKNEEEPVWQFQEGYNDFLATWKLPQTPRSWMKYSCIWFSEVLAAHMGPENFERYLLLFQYGNQDLSKGAGKVWINSSLKISPREQVHFLQSMLQEALPVSSRAVQMTKNILFIEELQDGWKLFGKTGWSGSTHLPDGQNQLGWFVGWIEKGGLFYPFAYNIREAKINLSARVPRVKELVIQAKK